MDVPDDVSPTPPLSESRRQTETEIELWPCQPIASWPPQARDASENTLIELSRTFVLCDVLVRAPRSRVRVQPGAHDGFTDGWDRTSAVLVVRFAPPTPNKYSDGMDCVEDDEEGQEIAVITPADLAVFWVGMMNYHAFLPVEGAAMVGHPEDVLNVLKEAAQPRADDRTTPCEHNAAQQGKCFEFRIPGSLYNILAYVGDGDIFFDEVQNKWRVVDGKNKMGRFDASPAGGRADGREWLQDWLQRKMASAKAGIGATLAGQTTPARDEFLNQKVAI